MLRYTTVISTVLLFTLSAAGDEIRSRNSGLLTMAAEQMKLKNYSSAKKYAVESPENGQRDLVAGVASFKTGQHEEAATLLGKAAKSFPLLADYALHYQAQALAQLNRQQEALVSLRTLTKEYPESPLARKSLQQQADILYAAGSYDEAGGLYQKFIEKYASGKDALHASYRSALCREKGGDLPGAAKIFRSIWLNSPATEEAAKTEDDLQRLAAAGVNTPAYTPQELFKRGSTLFDQQKFEAALKTFHSIPASGEKPDFKDRLLLKIGQTQLKLRRYAEASQLLKQLAESDAKPEIRADASLLVARAIEKSGRNDDAFVAYNRVAELFPNSDAADNALLDAAYIRKFQNRPAETIDQLGKLLEKYPNTPLKQRALWESGWGCYLAGRHKAASDYFVRLLDSSEYREKALYWRGRSLEAAGEQSAATESYTVLRKEFPFGYYTLLLRPQNGTAPEKPQSSPVAAPVELMPLPEGYPRVKALISLGLNDDAAIELAACRKRLGKGKSDAALARLYLEIGNYNGAMHVYSQSPVKPSPDDRRSWSLLYPQAYRELVSKYAEEAGIEPSLAYAVIRAESSFLPSAKSPVGARGLMQLMPDTAAAVMQTRKIDPDRLYEPELNIRLGSKHLRDLLDSYKGDRIAVIASYNAGSGNVNRWLKTYRGLPSEDFVESIPFTETREYVKKVLSAAALYQKLYGIK